MFFLTSFLRLLKLYIFLTTVLCPPSWIDFKNINSPATPRKIQANSRAMFDRAQIIKTATGWDNNLAMNNDRSLINKLQINTRLQTPSGKSIKKVFLF